ncbi:MAG TPA: glycosyltransferase family 2 protein [Bacteroidia bacterium]|jgi:glycosyltransferase involved in cell wall biosynthesis|nr:glycosyltransferase family 2 protein [Bacteroidia bacterium]
MEKPFVSIIMPAYNCEKYVKAAIDSVLNQTYTHFELLIADDCSKDSTKKIIDSYNDIRIKRFHNELNVGYLQASNKLLKECTGDYITFQDADDYSAFNRIELLVNFLIKNSDCSCVGSNIIKVDDLNNELYATNFPLNDIEIKFRFANTKVVMTGSSLLVKKEVIYKVGYYNLYFNRLGSEDVYWFSLILNNFKVSNISDKLYYYRSNPTSVTSFFKDPKTKVLHNLIVFLYRRRNLNKEDYLQSNRIKKTDVICEFLQLLNILPNKKVNVLFKYAFLSIRYPTTSVLFLRDFMYKFFKKESLAA